MDMTRSDLSRSACVHRLLHRPVPGNDFDVDEPECSGRDALTANSSCTSLKCTFSRDESLSASSNASPSPIESLPPDTSSYLLSYLHPHDLFNFALVSKCGYGMFHSELLWQRKFKSRWNCLPDPMHVVHAPGGSLVNTNTSKNNSDNGFWKQSYINAHRNPHDLWIRHWNCVYPEDVTTCSGRTVIPDVNIVGSWDECQNSQQKRNNQKCNKLKDFNSPTLRQCPTCRYHPMLHPAGYDDVLDAVEAEMRFVHSKTSATLADEDQGGCDKCNDPSRDPIQSAEIVAAAHALKSSTAKAMHYSTKYSIAKWCRNMASFKQNDPETSDNVSMLDRYHGQIVDKGKEANKRSRFVEDQTSSIRNKAQFAFECASTFDRQIKPSQYQSSGMNFLTDTLFFNIHPSCEKNRTSSPALRSRLSGSTNPLQSNSMHHLSMDELLRDVQPNTYPPESLSSLGPKFETSHHTWHVIRLSNPDFILPITFRVFVQSDNFTIYPSEGYIKPGDTIHLVLGVRMKGSLVNDVFEQFSIEKDDSEQIMPKGTHLPLVPFAIRYMFAPSMACIPHDYASRPDINARSLFNPVQQQSELVKFPSVLDQLWDNVPSEADVRKIYLSAHVHSNYDFEEFQHETLMPFDVSVNQVGTPPSTTIMPCIQQRSPKLFSLLQNLDTELEDSVAGELYRTEKKCEFCNRDWGAQSEMLGRAYLLRKLQCQKLIMNLDQQKDDFERTLNIVPSLLKRSLLDVDEFSVPRIERIRQLLFCMHADYLLQKRANRLVTSEERKRFCAYEKYIEETYTDLQTYLSHHSEQEEITREKFGWRGKKKGSKLWRRKGVVDKNSCCNDGFIGQEEDPNHEDESGPSMHTDMLHNDPLKAFVSAVSMISNPEYLHGVYDRVKRPGAIIRCPSLPVDVFFRPLQTTRDKQVILQKAIAFIHQSADFAVESKGLKMNSPCHQIYFKSINFEMNEPDPDGLDLVTLGQNMSINFHTSMAHVLWNIPFPGSGPLLLSSPKGSIEEYDISINAMYTKVQPYSNRLFPPRLSEINGQSREQSLPPSHQNQRREELNNGGGHGPNLELNIVWLIARHLGWFVDDGNNRGSLLVDRRLLIATQWIANTIMVFSLLASLLSRKFQLITSSPVNVQVGFWQDVYMNIPLHNSIKSLAGSSRFWSSSECGICAMFVFVFYFILGRSAERQIGQSFEQKMTEVSPEEAGNKYRRKLQWLWDISCPLFLQQRLYLSDRNRRTHSEQTNQVIHLRSQNCREQPTVSFNAIYGRGGMRMNVTDHELGVCKQLVGLVFFILSFSACSPHFVVNSLTVFCCGISYGMSLSLESMEIGRRTTSSGLLSVIKPRRINTLVMGYITIGQLVGSSGGMFFLAEFVVTAISLLLGGAATVTSSALESWITFFCLSSTAFFGFVFARLGLLDGVHRKKRGIPSALFCASLWSAITMWILVLTCADWYSLSPGNLIVAQARDFFSEAVRRKHS